MLQENSGYLTVGNNIIHSFTTILCLIFWSRKASTQNLTAVSVRAHLKAREFGLGSYLLLIWDLTIFVFGEGHYSVERPVKCVRVKISVNF